MNAGLTLPQSRRLILALPVTVALAVQLFSAAPSTQASSPVETLLHDFSAGWSDGASCYSGVIVGKDGALYGTTWGGGSDAAGTVYRVNMDGTDFALLHSFTRKPDGLAPFARLVQATDGLLYGTTFYGGVSNKGTVFRIGTNGGDYAVLYSFEGKPDGANPYGGLIQGSDGALYGTTQYGGTTNQGSVFKINPDGGGYTVLRSFRGAFSDASTPYSGLVEAADGMLYGTTSTGGSTLGGTIYRISRDGESYSILRHLTHATDGASPKAELMQGNDGFLYGTTYSGGPQQNGTVFRISTNGGFNVLYSFTNSPDGCEAWAGLVQGCDGQIYGTTSWGGNTNGGLIYRLNTDGSGYSILHHFSWAGPDGSHPFSTLAGGSNGVFYGTTWSGGTTGFGTVFRLALHPDLGIASLGNDLSLVITGVSNQPCRIEFTTNLVTWDKLADLILTNGTAQYRDPIAGGPSYRFYRTRLR
jgi:uncharacterized repeat protein (TIGR03803 family)